MKYIAVITDRYERFKYFMKTFDPATVEYHSTDMFFILDSINHHPTKYIFCNVHDHDRFRGQRLDEVLVDEGINTDNYDYFFKCIINPMLMGSTSGKTK